jgi:ubiquinone/menaquinone biosynthesis C-methylase UbiE
MNAGRMDKAQLGVVNSRIRQLFQKYYEFRVIKQHLKEHNTDLSGKVILDAGCGSGHSSEVIIKAFKPRELYAFDIMPEQVELAKQRGLPAHIFVGNIADMELASEKFDAVFTFGVFHHVPQWFKALQEVHRVLKPGGVLLGGEINKEKALDFEWSKFAQDLERANLPIAASKKIYMGYFTSFMCVKPNQGE